MLGRGRRERNRRDIRNVSAKPNLILCHRISSNICSCRIFASETVANASAKTNTGVRRWHVCQVSVCGAAHLGVITAVIKRVSERGRSRWWLLAGGNASLRGNRQTRRMKRLCDLDEDGQPSVEGRAESAGIRPGGHMQPGCNHRNPGSLFSLASVKPAVP